MFIPCSIRNSQTPGNPSRDLLGAVSGMGDTFRNMKAELSAVGATPVALDFAARVRRSIVFGLGVFAASRHNRLGDVGVMAASQLGIAIPNFWFAILLILLFAVQLQWVSAGGFPGWSGDDGGGEGGIWPGLKALLLPALSLAAVQAAILARVTRSAVLEAMREDYVRTARAKGLSRRAVLWRHVLRNAMIPVLTIMGLQFANLITGAIVVENVFVLPGIGRLVFQASTTATWCWCATW